MIATKTRTTATDALFGLSTIALSALLTFLLPLLVTALERMIGRIAAGTEHRGADLHRLGRGRLDEAMGQIANRAVRLAANDLANASGSNGIRRCNGKFQRGVKS